MSDSSDMVEIEEFSLISSDTVSLASDMARAAARGWEFIGGPFTMQHSGRIFLAARRRRWTLKHEELAHDQYVIGEAVVE